MVKIAQETSNNTNMNTFIYVIVAFMLTIFLIRAALGYKRYKHSIFPHIYDNYLIDYFYKLNVFQDASTSSLIKKKIGYHRLVYANVANKEGKLAAQIITLIHGKGILSIAYLNNKGQLVGNDNGFWNIVRNEEGAEKKYRIENPAVYLKEYSNHLKQVLPERNIEYVIALSNDLDFSKVKSNFKIVHFSDIEKLIEEADSGYGLNETEINEIFEKLGGKLNK